MTVRDRVSGRAPPPQAGRLRSTSAGPRGSPAAELLSVLTIDLARGLPPVDVDSVLSGGETVYASPTSLYVATERWTDGCRRRPARRSSTQIHRFDTSDPGLDRLRGERPGERLHAEPVVDVRAARGSCGWRARPRRPGTPTARSRAKARASSPSSHRRRSPARRRAGRRPRPRRGHLRRPLRSATRLCGHVPPGRPALRPRPLRPDRASRRRASSRSPGTRPICTRSGRGCCSASAARWDPAASRAACRRRSSTSPIRPPPSASTARTSGTPRTPRSSTTTTPSPGSTTPALALMPIDSYHGDGTTTHSSPGSA